MMESSRDFMPESFLLSKATGKHYLPDSFTGFELNKPLKFLET